MNAKQWYQRSTWGLRIHFRALFYHFSVELKQAATMELCIGSTTLLFNLKHRYNYQSNFRSARPPQYNVKLPSFCRRIERPVFRKLSSKFVPAASPSSSVAVGSEKEDRLPADIGVTLTQETLTRLKLSVEVPPAVCDDCYKRVLNEIMQQVKVPGFQSGKNVPENILVRHAGKEYVQKATVESILQRTLPHAISSVTGRALTDSVRIANNISDLESIYVSDNCLRYDVIVDVMPEVKWTPEDGYKNLKIVVEIDSEIDAQTASEQEFQRRHKALGVLKIVTERGLQVGDVAVIDVSATTGKNEANAQSIPSTGPKGFHFDTDYSDKLIPGFLDSIIGIKQGETKSFSLVFPESWNQENLRGVHTQFTVECKELFYRDLPELDDSLAEKLLSGCTTLQEVKESLLQKFLEVEQTARERATDNAILDQLCKMTEIEIPQSLFEEQGREIYGAKLLDLQAKSRLNEQQLASLSSPKAVNEYLENQKENITKAVKQKVVVGDIFTRENLEISSDELVKEVQNSITGFKQHKKKYDEEYLRDQVQEMLEGARVLEWLRERAEIQYITK